MDYIFYKPEMIKRYNNQFERPIDGGCISVYE